LATRACPPINALAQKYGLATNYFGTIHPSEGNYVSLVGGDDYGIHDDARYTTHLINKARIVDQLEAAGLTWKGYFQNLPFAGFAAACYRCACEDNRGHDPALGDGGDG
jgi:hypothetical protein